MVSSFVYMNDAPKQQNIIISACLLGNPVRYNGTDLQIEHPLLKQWKKEARLISICPEVVGGLATPRAAAEIAGKNGSAVLSGDTQVITNEGEDVTKAFVLGANKALQWAKANHCTAAILSERSPSCGSSLIYDGSFSNTRKAGMGVTATLLEKNGICVFNQYQLEELQAFLEACPRTENLLKIP